MITMEMNTTNYVVVTVTENSTLVAPTIYNLFNFINPESKETTTCISQNITSYPERYDAFYIIEQADPDRTNSQIRLSPGPWQYEIYEQNNATNLNPALATNPNVLEYGKVIVPDPTPIEVDAYTPDSIEKPYYKRDD